jgi:hypothetical protein
MKIFISMVAVVAAAAFAQDVSATPISGDLSAGGNYAGLVTSSNAWITSSAIDGEMVNFWTFNAHAGDALSLFVTSPAIEFGLSLYQGIVDHTELLFAGFNNAGDFGDNVFVTGTNPVTGAVGTSLLDVLLPVTGLYTIAVGGEQGLSYDGQFAYSLQADFVRVPEPATLGVFGLGMLTILGMRRRLR